MGNRAVDRTGPGPLCVVSTALAVYIECVLSILYKRTKMFYPRGHAYESLLLLLKENISKAMPSLKNQICASYLLDQCLCSS